MKPLHGDTTGFLCASVVKRRHLLSFDKIGCEISSIFFFHQCLLIIIKPLNPKMCLQLQTRSQCDAVRHFLGLRRQPVDSGPADESHFGLTDYTVQFKRCFLCQLKNVAALLREKITVLLGFGLVGRGVGREGGTDKAKRKCFFCISS